MATGSFFRRIIGEFVRPSTTGRAARKAREAMAAQQLHRAVDDLGAHGGLCQVRNP